MDILSKIVADKLIEIEQLKKDEQSLLTQEIPKSTKNFYEAVENKPFFICEFKRKSPSAGTIDNSTLPSEQAKRYISIGAGAISVLTDSKYFGGTYEDLEKVSKTIEEENAPTLVLQKDFILDPIQIYKARKCGADLILLIVRILSREKIIELKNCAEKLGMGCLVEVHNAEEFEKIKGLSIEVLGINNRNLSTFKTRLNNFYNSLRDIDLQCNLIAESGINNAIDFHMLNRKANGYLIGQSLMESKPNVSLKNHFGTEHSFLLKACGLRNKRQVYLSVSDLIGINFSPLSKRKFQGEPFSAPDNAVAVFKENSVKEILKIVKDFDFKYVQLYTSDLTQHLIDQLNCKIIIAASIQDKDDFQKIEHWAPQADLLILDGGKPGSGEAFNIEIPSTFNYPFLLAGGMNEENISRVKVHPMCIGADMATGIESNKEVDLDKVERITNSIHLL